MRSRIDYPISNQYTFATVFSNPDNVRPLLEAILGVPIGEIRTVEPEHTIQSSLRGKGVRMDVFVDDGSGTVYDVEMQNAVDDDLALRSRYLISSFDRDRIWRGEDYDKLGRSVVIFVCSFDPIGLGDRMYVIRPAIIDRNLPYDDGTMRVFLNAKGAASEGPTAKRSRLASFLSYVDGGGTMGDEWVNRLDEDVRALNEDEGWRSAVLGLELDYLREKRRSREEGLAEGRAEGRAEVERLDKLLVEALIASNRVEELAPALTDPDLKSRLLEELGIS